MTKLLGHWKLYSSDDKWDDYMKMMGMTSFDTLITKILHLHLCVGTYNYFV